MTAAYVEHRPRSNEAKDATIHFAVVVNGNDVEKFRTQEDAVNWAKKQGYSQSTSRAFVTCRTETNPITGDAIRRI